jgi:branched-chain amino acid transport system ATP-binding protein
MAGLNPTETDGAMQLIKSIRDTGVTIIMVEHNLKAVLGICDRVAVLNAGEKIAEGSPQNVVNDPMVITAYIGRSRHA